MGFIDFVTYIKHLGEKALVFFPSKTNLISVSDKDGEPTEELLSERLDMLLSKDGDASNTIVTFQEATERANIQTGDSLATAFAKLSAFCSSLETLETNVNDNKDRIVNGDYSVSLSNNGKLIGTKALKNPDGSTSSIYQIAIGESTKPFTNVYSNVFTESGKALIDKYALISSPTFTGTPKAPTAVSTSNDTTIATTAFVNSFQKPNLLKNVEQYTKANPLSYTLSKEFRTTCNLEAGKWYSVSFCYTGNYQCGGDEVGLQYVKDINDINSWDLIDLINMGKIFYDYFYFQAKYSGTYDFYWNMFNKDNVGLKIYDLKLVESYSPEMVRTVEELKKADKDSISNVDNTADKDKYVKGVIDLGYPSSKRINFYYYGNENVITTASWFPAFTPGGSNNDVNMKPISPANVLKTINGVNKSGDTMTGTLDVPVIHSQYIACAGKTLSNNPALIETLPNTIDANGDGIRIGGGGVVIVGSGESSKALWDNVYKTNDSGAGLETTVVASDNAIYFYTNCQTLENRKQIIMDNGGIEADGKITAKGGIADKTNNTATYLNYGAAGITTTNWLAAWNGYELRAISPENVKKVLGLDKVVGSTQIKLTPSSKFSIPDDTPLIAIKQGSILFFQGYLRNVSGSAVTLNAGTELFSFTQEQIGQEIVSLEEYAFCIIGTVNIGTEQTSDLIVRKSGNSYAIKGFEPAISVPNTIKIFLHGQIILE